MQHVETYSFALGPGEQSPAGTYFYHLGAGQWHWSDEIYKIHGYERAEVVPTTDLVLAHKHQEDRPHVAALFSRVSSDGGHFSNYHRIIDAKMQEHRVVSIGEARRNGNGQITAVQGMLFDLTDSVQAEIQRASDDAVIRSARNRALIEQAKGALMARFAVDDASAFKLLSRRSQATNVKLAQVAADLIHAVQQRGTSGLTGFLDDGA